MKLPKTVTHAVGERLGGNRPNPMKAFVTAAAVGGAVGVTVYRVLRS
jgi:hypothetical protein